MRSKKDSRHHPQTVARIAMLHFTSSFMLLLPLRPPLAAPQIKPVHLRVARLSDSCCARGGAVIAAMRSVEDEDVAQRMKRADLPSVEELSAASFLGGAAGVLVWRYIIGGSALFGALVGVGITRRIAYQPSKAGAYVREAGWVTHTRYLAVRARCKSANEWALAEAHQLGLPTPRELGGMVMELMRKALAEVKRMDESSGLSQRIGARLAPLTSRLRRLVDWVASGWSSPGVQRQVTNTGVPEAFRRFRQRAEERQQAELRRRAGGA